MKTGKKYVMFLILFACVHFSAKAEFECVWSSPMIYLEDGYQWCDQLVIPIGDYYKSQLQSALIEERQYTIIVRNRYLGILYTGTAYYTGNELWDNDNLIGFQNINHDVSPEDQE